MRDPYLPRAACGISMVPMHSAARRRMVALFVMLTTLLVSSLAHAFTPPPIHGHVMDTAGVLTQDEVLRLDAKLDRARKTRGFAVVVFVAGSLEGESIEDVAYT